MASAIQRPTTPMRMAACSPCPSASTSGPSCYEGSAPATPLAKADTTLAERRGKAVDPLADSDLLDHAIYTYARNTPRVGNNQDVQVFANNMHAEAGTSDPHYTPTNMTDSVSTDLTSSNEVSSPATSSDLTRRGLPSACVFVANLAATKNDEELQRSLEGHFAKTCTGRLHVKIRRDERGNPYSFVQFDNNEDAKKAVREGRGAIIDNSGRRIRCEPAKVNRTLLLARLDNGIFDEAEANSAVCAFGPLESLEFINAKYASVRGIRNGFYVRFQYRQDAVDCHQFYRSHNTWSLEWANNISQGQRSPGPHQHNNIASVDPLSIFVGQLHPDTTKELLLERFGKYGNIIDSNLVVRPGKFGLGRNAFAFIKYDDQLSATRAIDQEHNCPINGKLMHVQRREFHDKSTRPQIGQENQYGNFCTFPGDGRLSNGSAIKFSVADVADLATRLTLSYAHHSFNPRQPGLAPRGLHYPNDMIPTFQNGAGPYAYYPPFYYGAPQRKDATTQDQRYNNAMYSTVESGYGQNNTEVNAQFGAHYNPYGIAMPSTGYPAMGNSHTTLGHSPDSHFSSNDGSSQGRVQQA